MNLFRMIPGVDQVMENEEIRNYLSFTTQN